MADPTFSLSLITGNGQVIEATYTATQLTFDTFQITSISGTISGTPITGVSSFKNADNIIFYRNQRIPMFGFNGNGSSFSAGGKDYNIYNYPTGGSAFFTSDAPNTPDSAPFRLTWTNAPPICFVTGTRIRTSRGEVAVEDLQVGDLAVTASGTLRPITWIGHRAMTDAGAALPFHQQPVRVRAGAFGQGLPARDLSLSPGHPVLVGADAGNEGGVLVPIMCLINGTTITREPATRVTYWHVELDAHDILLAEGLPAESYVDGGDRAFFEGSDHALHNPDFVPVGWNARCRPVAIDGPVVEAERLRLDAVFADSLAAQCAWPVGELTL